jgi:hypothetical protein
MSMARKVLGLEDSASDTEISAAYHLLARMYHPDKVAGLAPEEDEGNQAAHQSVNPPRLSSEVRIESTKNYPRVAGGSALVQFQKVPSIVCQQNSLLCGRKCKDLRVGHRTIRIPRLQ